MLQVGEAAQRSGSPYQGEGSVCALQIRGEVATVLQRSENRYSYFFVIPPSPSSPHLPIPSSKFNNGSRAN
ncbi:hypothetical protein JYQ62_32175 [Nostoc sp. UHCC 0702]|nr:hypothetical protein JYQ62_32175 [Nostoc sp. UHCC 0702]